MTGVSSINVSPGKLREYKISEIPQRYESAWRAREGFMDRLVQLRLTRDIRVHLTRA